jgi:SAM-dependent methyltransferase
MRRPPPVTELVTQIEESLQAFPCDLCGQRDEEFLYAKPGALTNYPFRVVRCRSCGLIYLNPRLREAAIAKLYDQSYYDGKGFDPHVQYIADCVKNRDIDKTFRPEETARILTEVVPPPATLLDFGCGLGDLMRQAIGLGYRVEGFEVSRFAREFAWGKGLTVYEDPSQLASDRYDVVTAIEVLEHCSSPTAELTTIHRCLKPGGTLYYTTGNFDGFYEHWRSGSLPALDSYIVPEGHIHFFSTAVMRSYFAKIGFSQVLPFEPKAYARDGRLFDLLSRIGLIEKGNVPRHLVGKLSYYGARKVATLLGLRTKPLPLARK